MTDKVTICNSAIAKVGGARISSLSDDSEEARLCTELYPVTCKEMLRAHPWNFAIARVELAALAAAPEFGFAYQFEIPSDVLRILNVNHEDADFTGKFYSWKVEGNVLLASDSGIKVKYISDVSDSPHLFDAVFAETLSYRIAMDLAFPLANSNSLSERLEARLLRHLSAARTFDGQEGSSTRIGADTWLDARF